MLAWEDSSASVRAMGFIIFHFSGHTEHEMGAGHPERPERLESVMAHLKETKILEKCDLREPPVVTRAALERVHEKDYLDALYKKAPKEGMAMLDPDTRLAPGSLKAAEKAAGALEEAVKLVVGGKAKRIFCAGRPPGHHAESDVAMGFCFFNNVAVGAAAALADPSIKRVAVVDFDVHHGNGSVEMFQDTPEAMVCSSFQHPFYPNRYHDVERHHLVYTKLPAGTSGKEFREAVERDWTPALKKHKPDLLFISAGFDAHADDPLADLRLNEDDFRWVTRLLVGYAEEYCDGRVISTLEGGYNLEALSKSVAAHLEVLLD